MADTIARLIFEANTAQLKKANDELKKLAKESGTVTKSIGEETKATNKSTKARKAQTEEQKKATAIRKAEIKAYAEQARVMKRAEINANRENLQRKEAIQKIKESSDAAKKLAAAKAQEKEATKIKLAVQKAEINAYREEATRKKKATQSTNQNKNAIKKNSDEVKKANAIKRAEIRAYQEAAKMKEKAAAATSKLTKKEEKLRRANEKLANSFKNAANATATLTGPLNGISGRLSFIGTGLGRIGVAGVAFGAAMAGIGLATSSAIREFAEFESQVFKLEAMLRATGGTVGLTSQELQDLANDVGMATLASAGDIREAQGILLTFGSITGKQFKETTVLSQDLAAVMGVTAQSAAKTLGKALEDPINNLSSLSRAGVVFTDTEKEIIDALINTNRQMEAQDFIITKLTGKIGGAGEGAGKGLAGAFDGLSEQVGLLKQAFAEETGLADFFEARVKSLTAFAKSLTDAIKAAEKTPTPKGGTARKAQRSRLADQALDKANAAPEMTNAEKIAAGTHKQTSRGLVRVGGTRSIGGVSTDAPVGGTATPETPEEEKKAAPPPVPFADLSSTIEANERIKALDLELLQSKMNNATQLDESHRMFREAKLAADQEAAVQEYEAALLKAEQDAVFGEERKALAMEELLAKNELIMQNNELLEEEETRHRAKLGDIQAQAALKNKKFEEMTAKQKTQSLIKQYGMAFGAFSTNSKKMFKLQKAAGIANAVMDMYQGINAGVALGWPMAIPAVAYAVGTGIQSINKIKSQEFGGGSGGGSPSTGGGGGGGGGSRASAAAASAPKQPTEAVQQAEPPQPINVTVDGSIDPEGARRIIEAINEATEDGLEINALVGS